MKKLKLFISLLFTMFSVAVFAQAEFEKIAITQNTQDNFAGRLLVQDVTTGEIRYILKSVLDNKFNQPTGNATQYLDGAGNPTTFPVLGQSDRVITEVRNTTGATVTKGTVVYLTGASGGKPTIQKAQANAESTSSGTFGVIQSDINNNSNGYVVVIGTVLGVNTSSYSEGQILWLSPTTAGGFTTTKPVAPNHAVYVAIVTLASTQGTIEVKIQNGYEIDELHDVLIVSKTDNDGLIYDAASGLWKNKQITKSMVGLGNVDNTSDVNKPISTATQTALNLKENTANKNIANGYAGLGSDGKLISSQLPSITITDTFVVGSQSSMLSLVAETGDLAVRTDVNKAFILQGDTPSDLADWQELLTPTSTVSSVFGRVGAVTSNSGDYTADQINETASRKFQTLAQQTYNDATSSIQTQLDSKENLSNKSTSTTLGTSNTLYPTQNAVKTYVDGKVGGGDFANVVYVNSTDPNSASIFDLNNPPVTNNNALKIDTGNLYVGTNNSTWTYKTSPAGYYTYTVSSTSSNFYLSGTTVDAGSNKISEIQRAAAIKATAFKTTNGTASQFVKGDGTLDSNPYPSIQMSQGFIPSYNSAFNTLANSPIWTNGTFTGIGVSSNLNRTLQISGTTQISHKHFQSTGEMLIGQFDGAGNSAVNNTSNGILAFHTNNQRAMVINSVLRVGIGTNSPSARFQVVETNANGTNTNSAFFSDNEANSIGISNANGVNTVFSQSLRSAPLASDLAFATATNAVNGSPIERMRITSGGNVGIGTINPAQKLDVLGISRISNTTPALQLFNTTSGDNWATLQAEADAGTGGKMVFYTKRNGNSENAKMTIRENGYTGIGTTTPDTGLLSVLKNSTYNSYTGAGISLQSNTNNAYTELQMGADDTQNIGYIQSLSKNTSYTTKPLSLNPNGGNVGIGTTSPSARLEVSNSSDLIMNLTRSGVGGWGMNVTSGGNLFLNNRFGTNVFQISDGGNVTINNLGTGTVYSNAGTLTNTNPSDERLKDKITDLNYGLNEILQLRPVSYLWKNNTANQGVQYGFIAQEVQKIMPELVSEFNTKDGDKEVVRLGLDKEAIFVTLINAIKEQQAQIKELQKEIEILKNK